MESGSDGHFVLAPLYFQTAQNPEGTWRSFSPLHYYARHNPDTPDESSLLVLGPYLRSEDRGGDSEAYSYYTHLLPFYLHGLDGTPGDASTTELQITFPLYFNYRTPDRELHVNMSGLSLDSEKVPLPRLRRRQNGATTEFVIDHDIALFYNLLEP